MSFWARTSHRAAAIAAMVVAVATLTTLTCSTGAQADPPSDQGSAGVVATAPPGSTSAASPSAAPSTPAVTTPAIIATPPSAPPALTKPSVHIKGTLRVGQTLKVTHSTTQATKISIRWYRGSKAIKGATKTKYKTVAADSGKKLHVKLTLSAPGYPTITATSAKVKVAKIPSGVDARCMTTGKVLCITKAQHKLRYLNNGVVKKTTPVTFGRPSLPTVNGVFKVYYKNKHAYSKLYHATMPYAMFFYRGYAVHYDPPVLSHGCVHVWNMTKLKWLWNHTPIGTKVVV